MLRRIHDPERGAGFVEYGAVILLVAAIAAVVMTAGIPGRVNGMITDAIDSIGEDDGTGPQADGGGDEDASETDAQATGPDPGSQDGEFSPAFNNGEGLDITPAGFTSALPGGSLPDIDFSQGIRDLADDAADIGNRAGDVVLQRGEDAVDGTVQLFTTPPSETAANAWNGLVSEFEDTGYEIGMRYAEDIRNGNELQGYFGIVRDSALYGYFDSPFSQSLPALLANEDRREEYANGQWTEAITESGIDVLLGAMPGLKIPMPRGLPDVPDVRTDPDAPNLADGPPQRPDGENGDGNGQDRDEDNDRDGTSCPTGNSFVPGSAVLLADGTSAPIEDIAVGDEVLAFDPLTGEEGPREVTDTITGDGHKTLVTLTIATGDGTTDTITATDEHPFWAPEQAQWVDAIDLEPGTSLRTSTGNWVQVTSAEIDTAEDQQVHNLTVDGLHTYYVIAGDTSALVHNSNNACGIGNALVNWNSQRFQFGNQQFLLDKGNMTHILERHHPNYWDGSVKGRQSFFDQSMSIQDVQVSIDSVLRQNRETLVNRGSRGMYQIEGEVDGVEYVLGINRGHIGQFYPK